MRNFFLLLFTVIIVGFTTSCTTDLNEDVQYEASIAEADYQKAVQETVERISTE